MREREFTTSKVEEQIIAEIHIWHFNMYHIKVLLESMKESRFYSSYSRTH